MSKGSSAWIALANTMSMLYSRDMNSDLFINGTENPRKRWAKIERARKHSRNKKRRRRR